MAELFVPGRYALERVRVGEVSLNVRHDVGRHPGALPLLLVHGFPQTHAIWHRVAALLEAQHAGRLALVMPDLRGYGDSDKPPGSPDHATYSKRSMAADLHELMLALGFESYFVCGHDRGGRVGHRLALDQPQAVRRLMVLDISPTRTMYERTSMAFAQAYYHWFFLTQPAPLPEKLIAADPKFYLRVKMSGYGTGGVGIFDPAALAEYERCFSDPAAIHAMCEDYRAAASIDLEHDRADTARVQCPLRVLWGERGVVGRLFTPIEDWQAKCALPVSGRTTPTGHYIPEEAPELLVEEMAQFFSD